MSCASRRRRVVSLGLMALCALIPIVGPAQPKNGIVATLGPYEESANLPQLHRCSSIFLTDADGCPRIAQEPLVARTLTLSSFVPEQQKEKLALIADANNLLDSTLNPLEVAPPPATPT